MAEQTVERPNTLAEEYLPTVVKNILDKVFSFISPIPQEAIQKVADIYAMPPKVTGDVGTDIALDTVSQMLPGASIGLWGGQKAKGFLEAENVFSDLAERLPRFWIPDEEATLTSKIYKAINKEGDVRLGDVLQHKKAYENYPGMEDMPFRVSKSLKPSTAQYGGRRAGITVGAGTPVEEMKGVVLHEAQHDIDKVEKATYGASAAGVKEQIKELTDELYDYDLSLNNILLANRQKANKVWVKSPTTGKWEWITGKKTLKNVFKQIRETVKQKEGSLGEAEESWNRYVHNVGEIRARDVEARSQLTPKELQQFKQPYSTQHIPVEKMIVERGTTTPTQRAIEGFDLPEYVTQMDVNIAKKFGATTSDDILKMVADDRIRNALVVGDHPRALYWANEIAKTSTEPVRAYIRHMINRSNPILGASLQW